MNKISRSICKSLTLLGLCGAIVYGMTVEEAYRAIPHKRTVFDRSAVAMAAAEADHLVKLFHWVDQAIVAKVVAMKGTPTAEAYREVWKTSKSLGSVDKLNSVQKLITEAMEEQQAYLKARQAAGIKTFDASNPHVRAASGKLHAAYGELMRLYPGESPHNKQAFFDYLCALDFI